MGIIKEYRRYSLSIIGGQTVEAGERQSGGRKFLWCADPSDHLRTLNHVTWLLMAERENHWAGNQEMWTVVRLYLWDLGEKPASRPSYFVISGEHFCRPVKASACMRAGAQHHFQERCPGLSRLQVLLTFALLTLHEITKVLVDW